MEAFSRYRSRPLPVAPLRMLAAVGFWSDEPPSDAPMSRSWRLGLPSSHWLTWVTTTGSTEAERLLAAHPRGRDTRGHAPCDAGKGVFQPRDMSYSVKNARHQQHVA